MKTILLIVNPVSGMLKAKGSLLDIIDAFNKKDIRPSVALTQYKGHATELATEAAVSGTYDAVVCVGGDGTLNEVIAGIIKSGIDFPVGYIPAGSTNDFAVGIGLSSNPKEAAAVAADAIVSGSRFDLDIGKFGEEKYFTYISSFGAFTAASYSAPQQVKNVIGHLAYILEGTKDFFSIKPTYLKCKTAESTYEGEYVFAGVCNSFSVGGLVKLDAKTVDLTDGLFEIILIKNPKSINEFNEIVNALVKSDLNCGMIDYFRTSEVEFEIPEDTQWTLDGEQACGGSNVRIENIHKAVKLLK